MSQNDDILPLSKDFRQADYKADKHSSSSFVRQKFSPRLLLNIVELNYSAINTKSISNVKRRWAKIIAIEGHKRDIS